MAGGRRVKWKRLAAALHALRQIYYKFIQIILKPVLFEFPRSVVKATMVIIYIYKGAHKLPSATYRFPLPYTPKSEQLYIL